MVNLEKCKIGELKIQGQGISCKRKDLQRKKPRSRQGLFKQRTDKILQPLQLLHDSIY